MIAAQALWNVSRFGPGRVLEEGETEIMPHLRHKPQQVRRERKKRDTCCGEAFYGFAEKRGRPSPAPGAIAPELAVLTTGWAPP